MKKRQTVSKANEVEKTPKKSVEPNRNSNVPLRYDPLPHFPNQRLFARAVMIFAALVFAYFTSKSNKETLLAKQSELVEGRGQPFKCSKELANQLDLYPGCSPARCGRFVSDKLVTVDEAHALLDIGKEVLDQATPSGGVTILDLHSGALTQGPHFINIYKQNNTLFTGKDFNTYRVVRTKIQHAVAYHFGVDPDKLYLTHPTFFSRLTDKPPVTVHDEYWHSHVDKETYESFHYTSLLYLNDYGVDFQGGRFVFQDPNNSFAIVEPRKGRVSMFTSGKENTHYIDRVTSGVRYALTVSFTCDQNFAVKDPSTNFDKEVQIGDNANMD